MDRVSLREGVHLPMREKEGWVCIKGGPAEEVDAPEIELATIWAKVEELSKIKR